MLRKTPPVLILFKGWPATGKSHLARQLSERIGLELIVRDKLKSLLVKHRYEPSQLGEKSYTIMWQLADRYLASSRGCICDTSLLQPIGIPQIEALRQKNKAIVLVIECICTDEKTIQRRLILRKKYPSYYGVNSMESWNRLREQNKIFNDFRLPYTTLEIDTAQPVDLEQIVRQISHLLHEERELVT